MCLRLDCSSELALPVVANPWSPATPVQRLNGPSGVLSFHADLRTLGLMRHKASLLGQQGRTRFGLFDQLNAAVDGEHFLSLSAGLPGISNTHTHTSRTASTHAHAHTSSSVLLFFFSFSLFFLVPVSVSLQNLDSQEVDVLVFESNKAQNNAAYSWSRVMNIQFCCFQLCSVLTYQFSPLNWQLRTGCQCSGQ